LKDCWPSRYGASRGSPNPGPVPGLAEVQFHRSAQSPLQDVREVSRYRRVGQVVALALHDVGGELRRRVRNGIVGEQADVADEQAADHRVLAGPDRGPPVPRVIGKVVA